MLYEDLIKLKQQETLDFHGVSKWHDNGYRGKGIKILNLEGYSGHGKDTYDMIKRVAPDATIDWCGIGYRISGGIMQSVNVQMENASYQLDNVNDFLNILKEYDVISVSQSGSYPKEIEEFLVESGAVLCSAAGNDGSSGVTGKFKHIGLTIGAIFLNKSKQIFKESYSGIGEEIDFACLHMHLSGTSFSCPVFAGLCALIMQRYGKMSMLRMVEVMKSISIDAGDKGFDTWFGWGVPVLPDAIRMLEPIADGFLTTNTIFHTPLIQDNIVNFNCRESYPMNPVYITIHNFGSDANARDITKYVDNTDEVKSWHFTVGKDAIYQEMSIYQNGWHAGDGLNGTGNRQSIGIEVEENLESMMNAVRLCVYLRSQLGKLEIKFHNDWSGKDCPRWIMSNIGKEAFIKMIEVMELKFKDVEETRWSFKAIDYVTDKGYMKGFPDGTFKPSEPLTREQMAQVLYNMEQNR